MNLKELVPGLLAILALVLTLIFLPYILASLALLALLVIVLMSVAGGYGYWKWRSIQKEVRSELERQQAEFESVFRPQHNTKDQVITIEVEAEEV